MGHNVQAIVCATTVADAIVAVWDWPRIDRDCGFSILPVEAEFIDSVLPSRLPGNDDNPSPPEANMKFQLLTARFRNMLRDLSQWGTIAYIETDYFGGVGGQGAAVFCHGAEVLGPIWKRRGAINRALAILGVRRSFLRDRFTTLGLPLFRSNDDLLDAAD